jgi:hypothetical protein
VECEPTSTVTGVCPDDTPQTGSEHDERITRRLTIGLDPFAWELLEAEAAKQNVSVEELASFSVLYYLADGDSGRIARRLLPPRPLGEPHPLGKLLRG